MTNQNGLVNTRPRLMLNGLGLLLLVLASGSAWPSDELGTDIVQNRIRAIQESASSVEIETILPVYEEALKWLREAEAQKLSAERYAEAQLTSPQRQAEIRARLDALDDEASFIGRDSVKSLSWGELEQQSTEIRAQLTDSVDAREGLDLRIEAQDGNMEEIQARLVKIHQREVELPVGIVVVDPNDPPSQFEALQWQVAAEQMALEAERRALSKRLSSQSARFSLRKVEREELSIRIGILQGDLAFLEKAMAELDRFDSSESLARLQQGTTGYNTIQAIVDAIATLATRRAGLLEKLDASSAHLDDLQQKIFALVEQYGTARRIVDSAGGSTSFGRVFMVYWRKSDQYRPMKSNLDVGEEVGEQVIRRAEHERQLSELSSATAYVNRLLADKNEQQDIDPATYEVAIEQIRIKRRRLNELIDLETRLVEVLSEITRARNQLDSLVREYTNFLTSHILWVPSHAPLGKDIPEQLLWDIQRTTGQLKSISVQSIGTKAILGLIIGFVLLGLQKRWVRIRKVVNRKIGRPRSDSARYTLQALLLTLLQAAAVPLLIIATATSLRTSGTTTALDLANSMLLAAECLFLITFLRAACDEDGIARVHFGWAPSTCQTIHELATWALIWLWPMLLVAAFLLNLEGDEINAVLGRLVILAMAPTYRQ